MRPFAEHRIETFTVEYAFGEMEEPRIIKQIEAAGGRYIASVPIPAYNMWNELMYSSHSIAIYQHTEEIPIETWT